MSASSVTTEVTTNLVSDAKRRATRVVLPEEEYVSNLTDIVTRDFYPAIPSLQRDIAVLDCRSRGDVMGAIAIRRKARLEETQGLLTVDNKDRAVISITEFHQSAASEDNVEFEKNQQQEMLLHSQQIQQLYFRSQQRRRRLMDDNNSSTDKCVTTEEESALASDLFTVPKKDTAKNDSDKIEDEHPIRNALFFYPTPEDYDINKEKLKTLLSKISHQNDHLMIQQQGNNDCSKNNNKSIYATDSNSGGKLSKSENETIIETATAEAASSSGSRKRNIQYSQTRFPYQNSSRLPPTSTTSHQTQKTLFLDAIDDSDTDLDATPLTSLSIARKERVSRLSKELHTFIPMTPLRASLSLLSKPTKGRISSTNGSAPGGKWNPAAQRLLDRTTSSSSSIITNARMGSAFRSALRSSYTPKLPPSVSSSRSRKISSATPRATDVSYPKGNNHSQPMNTNDLLHIP